MSHYNSEHRAWRGRSYKAAGRRVRDLKEQAASHKGSTKATFQEVSEAIAALPETNGLCTGHEGRKAYTAASAPVFARLGWTEDEFLMACSKETLQ